MPIGRETADPAITRAMVEWLNVRRAVIERSQV